MKQKTAVCNALLSVLKERGVDYELNGETPISQVLTDQDKAKVREIVLAGFLAGEIDMTEQARAKYDDETKMKTYVSGVVNNWIKKNPEFNCGIKYVPKNKGKYAGRGDEQIRAMRALLKDPRTPTEAHDEINKAIEERLAEIKPTKTVEINVEALPEHLRHLAEKK